MTSKIETDVENLEETSWYMDRIFKLAQDRRYTTAVDCWAIILDAMFGQRKYVSIDGEEIIGITAADIATVLNMHLSSVYHNLKILQSREVDVLDTENLIGYNEKGRKITQKVFRIPEVYYTEYRRIYDGLQDIGFASPHKEFTFFNLLKIKGILSHYAALMNKDRILVTNETEEIKDWYTNWMNPLKLSHFNILPGVIYRFNTRDMLKILRIITELLEENKDNYQDENIKEGELPILFSYLVFAPYTKEMMENEWLNRDEYEERIEELTDRVIFDEEVLECEEDHETFFKYGISCPRCGKKPNKI